MQKYSLFKFIVIRRIFVINYLFEDLVYISTGFIWVRLCKKLQAYRPFLKPAIYGFLLLFREITDCPWRVFDPCGLRSRDNNSGALTTWPLEDLQEVKYDLLCLIVEHCGHVFHNDFLLCFLCVTVLKIQKNETRVQINNQYRHEFVIILWHIFFVI
jgi:hypothetical protein